MKRMQITNYRSPNNPNNFNNRIKPNNPNSPNDYNWLITNPDNPYISLCRRFGDIGSPTMNYSELR